MSADIKIRNGFDLNLNGEANKILSESERSNTYALKPTDFFCLKPKLLVNEGDKVKKGTPLFFSKNNPRIHFVSPVAGEILAISRGEKRKILEVVISSENNNNDSVKFKTTNFKNFSVDEIKDILLRSGSWPFILQRPYGIIAQPEDKPKAIYISTYSTSPLGVDFDFILKNKKNDFQLGLSVLSKLVDNVYLTVDSNFPGFFKNIKDASILNVNGPHPAGNVGVQIHHIDPVNKNDIVWSISPYGLIQIGRLFNNGIYDSSKIISLNGSCVDNPKYFKCNSGFSVKELISSNVNESNFRVISGNVLTGTSIGSDGYLGFYDNMITVIPEGNKHSFLGWIMPIFNKLSFQRAFGLFSFLTPNKKFNLDTNTNGELRAFVQSGVFEKVLPMDILPTYLFKSILAGDYDEMEELGIYELVEEDIALCEFVDVSKNELQVLLRKGLNMLKEG